MVSKTSLFALCILFASISLNAEKHYVPSGQYYAGGVLSIIPGFGIGHAVQERYREIGWVFTVSELGCAALASVGGAWVGSLAPSGTYPVGGTILSIAGGLGFVGFRIWEIVDAWTGAKPVETKHTSMFLNTDENRVLAAKQADKSPIFNFLSFNF